MANHNPEQLNRILSEDAQDDIDEDPQNEVMDYQPIEEDVKGMCIECTDQPATIHCDQCNDDLCEVCGYSLHRRGGRKNHTFIDLSSNTPIAMTTTGAARPFSKLGNSAGGSTAPLNINGGSSGSAGEVDQRKVQKLSSSTSSSSSSTSSRSSIGLGVLGGSVNRLHNFESRDPLNLGASATNTLSPFEKKQLFDFNQNNNNQHHSFQELNPRYKDEDEEEDDDEEDDRYNNDKNNNGGYKQLGGEWFSERSKYIPIRLDMQERNILRLLEASLHVSEYTDKVDIAVNNRARRINEQLRQICAILCGLLVASDFKKGQELVEKKEFSENEEFFQRVFEIGRRHKIMNPSKMRSEYGKMIHLLQDSSNADVRNALGLDMVTELKTVHVVLERCGGLEMLNDPEMETATREILPDGKDRYQIQGEIKRKERAIKNLSNRYQSATLHKDVIEQCIYSIGDNHTFLRENRDSVKTMMKYLKQSFNPNAEEQGFSLAIMPGQEGARLRHSHRQQYMYVYQSLVLWKKILHDMFRLWYLAEQDLLHGSSYQLKNTGQGLNRVQQARKINGAMNRILSDTQAKLGEHWIGSSVIHLGDNNVPNALTFIDKYTQISRILNPIVITIQYIPKIKDPHLCQYIRSSFGGPNSLIKLILTDFFRHAFDGSGADNFFDAGSCIDGRLTSAWNWCSKIEKKSYYPVFLLAGFSGFDGSFN
ncbi:hypothetical protein DFA_09512 [Cavenderia fasciculata]|uniref:B box-type domain-containing protein n=1 Tax=Cavenderia fasciculata TaxID=261658 RepID=F4Q7U3_CACFS|nr:uncharacterized protein DFA_09512 [Cavenderia fasciculata]EGG15843.1 hypothetical protein DFA_09512 [Cavenderia fasciculata]|eukprot:XP_004352168.1 hypothetical protein DFA_09512 [Cavenderia fasciculata]